MVATKKKQVAQRDSGSLLHAPINRKKESANNRTNKKERLLGVAPQDARITLLEDTLVTQSQNPTTSFEVIHVVSNPEIETSSGSKILQLWFETYRTIKVTPIASYLHEEQEVVFGTNIISSMSTEDAARRECYGLQEELEERFIGFMPSLGGSTNVIYPIHDIEASFLQMETSGVFVFNCMWLFQWDITKGAKP